MLRIYNYSIEETTSAYMAINDDGEATPLCHTPCQTSLTDVFFSCPTGILDYSDIGVGHNPFRNLTEKKLKETVRYHILCSSIAEFESVGIKQLPGHHVITSTREICNATLTTSSYTCN